MLCALQRQIYTHLQAPFLQRMWTPLDYLLDRKGGNLRLVTQQPYSFGSHMLDRWPQTMEVLTLAEQAR